MSIITRVQDWFRPVLSDRTILEYNKRGLLIEGPISKSQLQPNSVDLTLANTWKRPKPNSIMYGSTYAPKDSINPMKEVEYLEVSNTDRSFGTIFGSEITRRFDDTLEEDTFLVKCTGAGGQSFGAFIPKGLTLELVGDSNDYFGKGLSGGKLVVYPPTGVTYRQDENIIIGNVALYGATSGKAFINGVAGERFCVRNSGASAVVEGVGDHGCEYMTGGRVVVLGKTGKNFAAGMSGGIAYVLDEDNDLYTRINKEMVFSEEITSKYDVMELKDMIKEHVSLTNSQKGKEILDHFSEYLPKFKKIVPYDYHRMMMAIVQMEEKGLSSEQAQIEAFYANMKN